MSGTSFFKIYKRAITEFKDPTIKSLFEKDVVMFSQVMYNFLENAISSFTNPLAVQKKLSNRKDPILKTYNFIGDGSSKNFTLSPPIEESLVENSITVSYVNNEIVESVFSEDLSSVEFKEAPAINDKIEIEVYFVGEWNENIFPMEEYILSQFIMACWSQYIQNDKLDIIRLLGDTDFKLTSVSSATTAKSNWNIVNRENVCKAMNKYAWDAGIQRLYK